MTSVSIGRREAVAPLRALVPNAWASAVFGMFVVAWGANMFVPLLQVYRATLSPVEVTALFGAYALGLMPALLLLAPVSDRWGRRAVLIPALLLSAVGSGLLLLAGESFAGLLVGRILVGIAAGATFGPGTAWVKELSVRAGESSRGVTRAAVALSAGFAAGPLIAGMTAQWLPGPELTPYLVHLVLVALVLPVLWTVPETVTPSRASGRERTSEIRGALRSGVFLKVILPTAPWVFGAATTPFTVLPGLVALGDFRVVASGVVAALTLGTGVLVQPWGRSLANRAPALPFRVGLGALAAGMLTAALTAHTHLAVLLVPTAVALGAAYGLLLVGGLSSVEDLASSRDLATLTSIFYVLTYVGFGFPLVVSALAGVVAPPQVLVLAALVGAAASVGTFRVWPAGRSRAGR
jgi:predicted MFS family arabinose efflux permease